MKGGTSCGVDKINSYSLKLAAPLVEDALLHLVNLFIQTSSFPKLWKHQLIPQNKKKDHAAPQGSILGGLLFIINENEFPACRVEGESVLFVDDDTDVVSDPDPVQLMRKIQKEADLSCSWLKDNRMTVAGEKSKLLIVGTKELRRSKLTEEPLSVLVVSETKNEKLLGIVINNQMTKKEHLYGEDWRMEGNSPGLIPQLTQRLGILRKLSKYSSKKKLKIFASGLFYSKLSYCLPLFTNTWGLDSYKEQGDRFTSYTTKEDNRGATSSSESSKQASHSDGSKELLL